MREEIHGFRSFEMGAGHAGIRAGHADTTVAGNKFGQAAIPVSQDYVERRHDDDEDDHPDHEERGRSPWV
jgi:hypothetical protein